MECGEWRVVEASVRWCRLAVWLVFALGIVCLLALYLYGRAYYDDPSISKATKDGMLKCCWTIIEPCKQMTSG